MTQYRWRSYVLEFADAHGREALYLSNVGEARKVLVGLASTCAHVERPGGLEYRLDRVWLDNGFEVAPSAVELIKFPARLASFCACRLVEALR